MTLKLAVEYVLGCMCYLLLMQKFTVCVQLNELISLQVQLTKHLQCTDKTFLLT